MNIFYIKDYKPIKDRKAKARELYITAVKLSEDKKKIEALEVISKSLRMHRTIKAEILKERLQYTVQQNKYKKGKKNK